MVPRAAVLLMAVTACGRIGFDPETRAQGDAADDAVDAVPGDGPCTVFGPWTAPVPLTGINSTSNELGPAISPDGLTLYFASNRPEGLGMKEIYYTTRTSIAAPFAGPVVRIDVLNSTANDHDVTVTAGGTRVYFASTRGSFSVWMSDRIGSTQNFTAPIGVMDFVGFAGPFVSDNELEAILTGGMPTDMSLKTRPNTASAWTDSPGAVASLNAMGFDDGWPSVGNRRREIVFETNRSVDAEIWTASRADESQPFGAPTAMDLDHAPGRADADPELTDDGLTLYFASYRPNAGDSDLYVATRSCTEKIVVRSPDEAASVTASSQC